MITAVYQYWKNSKPPEMMRLSIESVKRNLLDIDRIVVVGDDPKVDGIDYVSCPRITGGEFRRRFGCEMRSSVRMVDQIVKLLRIIDCDKISDPFLRLYDDHFFLRPVSASEFITPRYRGRIDANEARLKGWQETRRQTFWRLKQLGLPSYDYSTHAPQVFEKCKIKTLIEEMDLLNRPGLFESLYHNRFRDGSHKITNRLLFRYVTCTSDIDWNTEKAACVCVQNKFLHKHLPLISSFYKKTFPT